MAPDHLFLCFVLFTSAVCFNTLNAIPERANDGLTLDANSKGCNCVNGKCVTDKLGHTKCVCKPGFAHQDEFTCKPCDCGSLGKCIFTLMQTEEDRYQYQKKCVCDVGKAEKDGVCVDCFCGENSACDFDHGERRCYCIDGYSEKDGICTKCDCGFYGECEYENDIKKCTCEEGFFELNGICEECDCGDHGTCSFEKGQKICKCEEGFVPNNGKCETCDCGSHSKSCEFVGGVKRCNCKVMYAERHGTCEECYCGAYTRSCRFNDNQKACSCLIGYVQKGETCEIGCSRKNTCQNGGRCKDGFCSCLKGTSGEFCEEIDYCPDLCPRTSDVKCSYDISSQKAYCECLNSNLRFHPNTRQCRRPCRDDSECKNQGKCTSTSREKFCECPEGTTGDFCEDIPVCKGLNCGPDADCVFKPSTKKATCACRSPKFKFDRSISKCRYVCDFDSDCVNGGVCVMNNYCYCHPGTQGDRCQIVEDCHSGRLKCLGHNSYCTFDVKMREATCKCKNWDEQYDFKHGTCRGLCKKNSDCHNGGSCGYGGFCNCLPGTQGPRCEIVNDCHIGQIQCKGGRHCCAFDLSTMSATCTC